LLFARIYRAFASCEVSASLVVHREDGPVIDSLFFVLQVIGIVVILGWVVVHDRLEDGARSSGPLAFKQADDTAEISPGRARAPGLTRQRRRANLESRRA
jgi:hypothetical protein